jgi:hypothetical protein
LGLAISGEKFVSNVIDFLERFGRDADLRHATDDAIADALRNAGIEPQLQAAILNKDQGTLQALLGGDTNVCCLVHSPDEEEEEDDVEEEDEDEEDEDEDEKSELDSEVVARRHVERVA